MNFFSNLEEMQLPQATLACPWLALMTLHPNLLLITLRIATRGNILEMFKDRM